MLEELSGIYSEIKPDIINKLKEFSNILYNENNYKIFQELSFCLLTPQSNAKNAWKAICTLNNTNKLLHGIQEEISEELNIVRFKNNKAKYLIEARKIFFNGQDIIKEIIINNSVSTFEKREWLVKNIKGMAYKEASHFLRNIGLGDNIAILDRHILRNLEIYAVIETVPKNLSKQKYLEIEQKMIGFGNKINIPISHLDILFWYKEHNEIFK